MSISHCMLSGVPLTAPMLCLKSGHVCEQSVLLHYIQNTGKCPFTDEPITISDCVPVQPNSAVNCESDLETVPEIFSLLRSEWSDLALETYKVKHQNEELQQELLAVKYQYDAASRTIARLLVENEQLGMTLKGLIKNS